MLQILKKTFSEFSEDNCSRMAAALAYYTAFSLAPLLILIVTLCGLVWDPADVRGSLESEIQSVFGADGAAQIKTMLANAEQSDKGGFARILSVVLLVVGATGLVGQLQGALNDAWEVKPDPDQGGIRNFVMKRLLSLGMICGIAFLLLVSLAFSTVLTAAGTAIAAVIPAASDTALHVINLAVSFLLVTVLFAAMFKFLPDAQVKWSDVGVGAGLTAVLFIVGKFAIGAYLGSKNMDSTYGAAGSLALILVWIYYSAMIFLFGAEFTQVWARKRGSGVQPAEGAVKVEEKTVRKEANTPD